MPPLQVLSSLPYVRRVLVVACLALVYLGAARLGFRHAILAEQVTLVWPPSGIALAAVLLLGRAAWPGILLGAFVANATTGLALPAALAIAVGNTLEALAAALLLTRFGFRVELARLRDAVLLVVLAALVSTTVSASMGAATLTLSGVQPSAAFPALWRDWWLGDAVGVLTVAPIPLTWFGFRRERPTLRQIWDASLLAASLVGACLLAFAFPSDSLVNAYPFHYLVVPFVAWAGLRFGPSGSAAAVLVTASIAVASTAEGLGPFALRGDEALLLLQLFVAVVALTGLILGATISERNAIHEALLLTQARLRLALSAARIGSWRWDIRTNQVEWSDELEPIHGLAPGSFRGTFDAFMELVHPEDREGVNARIAEALQRKGEFEVEFRNQRADGMHWISGRGRVFTSATGEPVAILGIGMDVTERRRLTDELQQRARELSEHDRRKDEFLATLAHELRNPLAPIAAAVDLLRIGRGNPASIDRLSRVLERQTAHLTRLVDDLLDVSRITSGKVQLRVERVDLNEVVSNAVDMSRSSLEERNLVLELGMPREPVAVKADATRLTQVVANLLSNAARHGRQGGHVWLSVQAERDAAVLRVRDDGPGMSPELLERAFDLFAQGPDATNKLGLGIGLTLTRMLVELHGGTVQASSEGPGLGSEFVVRLPLGASGSAAPAGAIETLPADTAVPKRRVLVVDDNADAAETLAALLELRGHEVSIAYDGRSALELAQGRHLDVVLLDIEMPSMNGYQVARAMRADPRLSNAQLVAVSGHAARGEEIPARLVDFDAYMVKPVDSRKLYSIIEGSG